MDILDFTVAQAIAKDNRTQDELFMYCRNMINSFDGFDYVIVDCPPNKMFLTQAMLRACAYYIAVTIPDKISVYGMPRLIRWVKEIPKEVKPILLGCILNGVNRSGGYKTGTINQQTATFKLNKDISSDLDIKEKKVIGEKPLLGYIPKLDIISKFLSQEDEKIARFDFSKSTSGQRNVNEIMMNLIKRIDKNISEYAKT